jgi:hypothetical protein
MKDNIKYLKGGQATYCCKGQVLIHLSPDMRDIKLISTLHTAKFVETEKKNGKGGTMKKLEIIQDYNKFVRGMGRADQILLCYPSCRKTVKQTKKFVFFLLHMAALKSFILYKKYKPKSKGQVLCFQGLRT